MLTCVYGSVSHVQLGCSVLLTTPANVLSSKPDFLTSYHNPPSALLHVLFKHAPVGPPLCDSAVHAKPGWGNVVSKQHCCPHYRQLNNETWVTICGPQWLWLMLEQPGLAGVITEVMTKRNWSVKRLCKWGMNGNNTILNLSDGREWCPSGNISPNTL